MADIFISYKREDRAAAELVDKRLQAEGWSTWWDTSLVAGDTWNESIRAELKAARCVVVLWSVRSWGSRWVQAEAHAGFERDALVAGRLDEVALEPPFNIVQTADLRGRSAAGLEQLVEGVRRKLGAGAGRPAPERPRREARGLPRWAPWAGGAAGALGLLLTGALVLNPPPPGGEVVAQRPEGANAASPSPAAPASSPVNGGAQAEPRRHILATTAPASLKGKLIDYDPAELPDFALFRECAECPDMVILPAGSFLMGSPESEEGRNSDEGPQRRVSFANRFAVGRFEVTFDEWDACVAGGGCNGYRPEDQGWGRGMRPVINVSWDDAQAYARWLSAKTGQRYRLLTEAEWEYAARAGTTTRFSFGDDESQLGAHAWFADNSSFRTQPVGGKATNPWGIHDMHGNVWEWVEDCYPDGYCLRRVDRGGSGGHAPDLLRSALRGKNPPGLRYDDLGFRVARTL